MKELLRGSVKSPEPAEVTALLIEFLWERALNIDNTHQKAFSRAASPPAKATAKKSSVLQSIYGEWKNDYTIFCYCVNVVVVCESLVEQCPFEEFHNRACVASFSSMHINPESAVRTSDVFIMKHCKHLCLLYMADVHHFIIIQI